MNRNIFTPCRWWSAVCAAICLVSQLETRADFDIKEYAVRVTAEFSENPAAARLVWAADPNATEYKIYKLAAGHWDFVTSLAGDKTTFEDKNVTPGKVFEYKIEKQTRDNLYQGYGYIAVGSKLPLVEQRGRLILVVESSVAEPLKLELKRLEYDLIGEGWTVVKKLVAASDTPQAVKAQIKEEWARDPANTKALLLFGHVPVPYSGNIMPDDHPNHRGAWPGDTYYADLDGNWTDTQVNSTTAEKIWNINVPGDGKLDQDRLPSRVELMTGRVDLSRLTCYLNKTPARSEIDLLRQYLDKNHNFRTRRITIPRRAIIFDTIGSRTPESLTAMAWRNFTAMVGNNIERPDFGQFLSMISNNSYLWCSMGAGGTYTYMDGVATSDSLALNDLNVAFTMFCGSYFGDWDTESNFLRSALAAKGLSVAAIYGGKPQWICHHMALGEPLGNAARITQENGPDDGLYPPHNQGAGEVHITLHGDPTLTAYPVAPVTRLQGAFEGTRASLNWTPSSEEGLVGYAIYKAGNPNGPYQRLNPTLTTGSSFTDENSRPGETYMVRAVALTQTPSGSFYNASSGRFFPDPSGLPQEATPPSAPDRLMVAKVGQGAMTLKWVEAIGEVEGYRIERKGPGEDSFRSVGQVGATVLSFTDAGLSSPGIYQYRAKAFNSSGESGYSNTASRQVGAATAEFSYLDTTTKGNWKGVYGLDGADLFESESNLIPGGTMSVQNAALYKFNQYSYPRVDDDRALLRENLDERWLTCWYTYGAMSFNLAFDDNLAHQVSFYSVDWQRLGRGMLVDVYDSFTNAKLDSRSVLDLSEGVYLTYIFRGSVTIRFTATTADNVSLFGIFFDTPTVSKPLITPGGGQYAGRVNVSLSQLTSGAVYRYTLDGSTPTANSIRYNGPFTLYSSAQVRVRGFKEGYRDSDLAAADFQNGLNSMFAFLKWDDQTSGRWSGVYGSEGFVPAGDSKLTPQFADVVFQGQSEWLWQDTTTESRGLLKTDNSGSGRAACWYSPGAFTVNLGIYDTKSRAVALYFLDWDKQGREQEVEIRDSQGVRVEKYIVNNFENGKYLVINLIGQCTIKLTRIKGDNAVLSGIFFDEAPQEISAPPVAAPLTNFHLENSNYIFSMAGKPGQKVCLDITQDLRTWRHGVTNAFGGTNITVTVPVSNVPVEYYRLHFVP